VLGVAAQFLFYGHRPGLNVLVGAVLFLGLAWAMSDRRIEWKDAWIPLSAVVFAALLAVRTEAAVVGFDLAAAPALAVASAAALGGPVTRLPLVALVARVRGALVATLVGASTTIAEERRHPLPTGPLRRAGPYAAGILLALPLLAIFGALFVSADAIFAHALDVAVRDRLAWLRETPGRAVLVVTVAWLSAGSFVLLMRSESGAAAPPLPRPIQAATALTLLIALDALFAAFVGIQIAYLFGGRDTIDAAGITYSAYGRRGFFELVAVSAIVSGLLFALDLLADRRGRAVVAAALVLVAFTGVIVASAAFRMDLYQRAYGWSELRFHAFAGIGFLALVLAVLAWAIASGRMSLAAQPIVIAALLVALAVNAIGPSAFVARMNVARVVDPSGLPADAERTLDVGYLRSLGDAAIPVLVDALPSLPPPDRARVEAVLRQELATHPTRPMAWEEWNWDRERAVAARAAFACAIRAPSVCSASGR
jgi:hypothetical protein